MPDKFPNMPLQCNTCVFEKFFEISLQKLPDKKNYVFWGTIYEKETFLPVKVIPQISQPHSSENITLVSLTLFTSKIDRW